MAERWLVETMPLQGSPHGPVLRAMPCATGPAASVTLVVVEEWETLERPNARRRGDWFPFALFRQSAPNPRTNIKSPRTLRP